MQATAEDLNGPAQRGPQARDGWMTDLPPERQATTMMPQGNQTSFSQQGIKSRGDTSDWTMTPAQRLLQLQVCYLHLYPASCQRWLDEVTVWRVTLHPGFGFCQRKAQS